LLTEVLDFDLKISKIKLKVDYLSWNTWLSSSV